MEKLPTSQALGKFSQMSDCGGPSGLRPISARVFSELKTEHQQRPEGEGQQQ